MKIVPLFHFWNWIPQNVPQKYYDSVVIFDVSTPGSTNPESLRAESYEIFRVKKPRGSVKGIIIISFYVWLKSFAY